ncbi:RDD family protein [Nocardioides panacisoli]|uniref:RDD family protein n=1 Tax=Nocardioides panacisoli TaxID=627624 RepID=UPI001C632950|nr:RDD family protein [Nocardioides panacisoli]QYJ05595.1 RDD family protein [Nocardioides panacisoli]
MSSPHTPIWELPDEDERVDGLDEYGDPDPAYAAALGLLPAPLGRRAGAAAVDIGLYLLLQVPYWVFSLPLLVSLLAGRISWYGFVNHPDFILAVVMASVTTVLTLAFVIVQLALLGRSGVTLGKAVTGLRAVNVRTLAKPGFWRVALRGLVLWGSAAAVVGPLVFLLSPLFDPQRRGRGWHDVIGQLWLVDVRHGLHPYDKKRMRIARKTVTAAPAPQAKALPSLATATEAGHEGEYRPAGRTSAGVLGVARPHGAQGRTRVGLTGLEQSDTPPAGTSGAAPGRPVIGGYLSSQSDRPAAPTDAAPPTAPSSVPSPQPPASPAPPAPEAGQASSPPPAPPAPGARRDDGTATSPLAEFLVRLDTGDRIEIAEPLLVGRMPADREGARTVAIDDDSLSVSKTHLVLRPAEDGVEVVDQGSTNGTSIVHDGKERSLPVGEAGVAVPGDTIRFGDRSAAVART